MLDRQASDRADFSDQNMGHARKKNCRLSSFLKRVAGIQLGPEISPGWLGYLIAGFIGAVILIFVARAIETGATGDDKNQLINVVRLSGPKSQIWYQRRGQLSPGSAIPHSKSMESS
jgi:Transglycosylase associated protein